MKDDAELIREYADAKGEAPFRALVERHAGLVYSSALRQLGGDSHRAQDVTQEVFVLLARKAPALRRHPTLAGWLYSATHFKVSSARRSDRRRAKREQEIHAMQDQPVPAAPEPSWDRLRPMLDEVILELGERDREALLLRYFQGQAYAEIAARYAVTESAAQKRVDRAIERLRRLFARRGLTSSSAALGLLLTANAAETLPMGLVAAAGSAGVSAGAAATGGFWTAFFTSGLSIMTTANKTAAVLAALSLAANAALVGTIAVRHSPSAASNESAPVPKTSETGQAVGPATTAARGLNLTPAQWADLRSSDLATQVARLRAAGLPPEVIATLTWAQLWPKYEARMVEIYGADKPLPAYWEHEAFLSNFLNEKNRGRDMQLLVGEMLGEMRGLLGSDAWHFFSPGLVAELREGLGNIAVEKLPEVLQRQSEFRAKRSEIQAHGFGVTSAEDTAALAAIDADESAAIAQLLSPSELQEFELHRSGFDLRERIAGFDPSEDEFKAVYAVQKQYVQEHPGGPGPSQPERQAYNVGLRDAVAKVLTPERAEDYNFATTTGMLARLAVRIELPRDKARELVALQQRTVQSARAIRADTTLSPAATDQRLAELATNVRSEGTALLGPVGFDLWRMNAIASVATLFPSAVTGTPAKLLIPGAP